MQSPWQRRQQHPALLIGEFTITVKNVTRRKRETLTCLKSRKLQLKRGRYELKGRTTCLAFDIRFYSSPGNAWSLSASGFLSRFLAKGWIATQALTRFRRRAGLKGTKRNSQGTYGAWWRTLGRREAEKPRGKGALQFSLSPPV